MHNGPEASVVFVDDSVPASSSARIDSENLHHGKVRRESDGKGATLVRMSRGSLVALTAVAVLFAPPLARATSVERVRVAGPGVTAAFPKGISLELSSPPTYARKSTAPTRGVWNGPEYWASGDAQHRGATSISWSVDFQARAGSAKATALSVPQHGWPLEKKDPIAVPHYVGKRAVGTILGYYALMRAPAPDDASFEAALAFPVAPRAFAVVRFDLTDPSSDSSGEWGHYLVGGLDLPSVWNRGAAFWAMSSVRLIGNLPPARIVLSDSGRTLRGSVSDAFYHAVLGLPVSIQRRVGGSWRPLASTRTNKKGEFAVRAPSRGAYRAVAKAKSKRVLSRELFVG
jgi:hypothetical protein